MAFALPQHAYTVTVLGKHRHTAGLWPGPDVCSRGVSVGSAGAVALPQRAYNVTVSGKHRHTVGLWSRCECSMSLRDIITSILARCVVPVLCERSPRSREFCYDVNDVLCDRCSTCCSAYPHCYDVLYDVV